MNDHTHDDVQTDLLSLTTADGHPIGVTIFHAKTPINRLCVIAPALGLSQEYYRTFCQYLATSQVTVITFDYRSLGRSKATCCRHDHRLEDWAVQDLRAVLEFAQDRFPSVELTLIGHSMGAQLIGLVPNITQVSTFLAVGGQLGYWRLWRSKVKMFLLWYGLFPLALTLFRRIPGRLVGFPYDLNRGVAQDWMRWCRSRDYFTDENNRALLTYFHLYTGEKTFFALENDFYAPTSAVEALLGRFSRRADDAFFKVSGVGHFDAFRLRQSWLWPVLLTFILKQESKKNILDSANFSGHLSWENLTRP